MLRDTIAVRYCDLLPSLIELLEVIDPLLLPSTPATHLVFIVVALPSVLQVLMSLPASAD